MAELFVEKLVKEIAEKALDEYEYKGKTIRELADLLINGDAVEVVHGHWYVSEYEYLNCSVCGEEMYTGCNSTKEAQLLKEHWKKFCPNCGAKMDGEGNGNL